MKQYRATVYPAMEQTNKAKVFLYKTDIEMNAAIDSMTDLMLFLQDDIKVISDYSNCFLKERFTDGEWVELE